MPLDYRKFHNLEAYLLSEVGPRFAKSGRISPSDFFMIIIWKANRSKTQIRDRLIKQSGDFDTSVRRLAASLYKSDGPKRRLEVLMKEWGLRLPMATAILTILYPDDFSVYDERVCEQLGGFEKLTSRKFTDKLWNEYQEFLNAVHDATPAGLSLRDKDRYLWGRSLYQSVKRDIRV